MWLTQHPSALLLLCSSEAGFDCLWCSIASTLFKQGKLHEAMDLLSQAHAIYQASHGPDHPRTQQAQKALTKLRCAMPSMSITQHTPHPIQQHIRVGACVRVWGLVSAPQHNGCSGVMVSFNSSKQRYGVLLDNGKALSLKPACLLQMAEVELENAGQDD